MRLLVSLLFLMMMCEAGYARKRDAKADRAYIAGQQTRIDSLNKAANDIFMGSPDAARVLAEKALLLSEKIKYDYGTGWGFLNMGHIYWAQSYYSISLFYLNSAVKYLPQNKPLVLALCYSGIGRTYTELENYKGASHNLEMALKYSGDNKAMLAEIYSERSYLYSRLNKYDLAIQDAKQAIKFNREVHDNGGIAILYNRLSAASRFKKQYLKAITYSDTALQMSYPVNNKRLRAKTYLEFAYNYNALKQYDKGISYANKGLALSDSIGLMDGLSLAYKTLAFCYEQKKNLQQAMAYQKKYIDVLTMVNTRDKVKNTQLVQNYFTLSSRLNEIAVIERKAKEDKARISSQSTIIITLTISLLLVIIALSVIYFFYKQKQHLSNRMRKQHEALLIQKQLIEDQSANLTDINKLKDKLLAVIGHDLRSPISNLRSITDLFEKESIGAEEVSFLVKKINPVIKGAELTLSNLLEWAGNHLKGINVNPSAVAIDLIGAEMEQTFNYLFQQKNIAFNNEALPGCLVQADEKHLKVVLSNLISNAVKFTSEGAITLTSWVQGDMVTICVADTGKGIAAEQLPKLFSVGLQISETGTLGEKGTGIGLFLCKELIEFNGGKLWVTSEVGKGSKFCFNLPLVTSI